jgi:cytochrome oxidase assembly protein ShyY1
VVRRFLTLRWVTIHLLTIAIVIVFILFGRWQLHRWESRGTTIAPPDSRPAVTLNSLVSPDEPVPGGSIGRSTTVTGSFDGAHQVLVADRPLAGRSGYWVVTPLRPTGAAGAAALVVRGWVPTPNDPALSVRSTPVTVSGRLYASDDPPAVGSAVAPDLPPGQYREVNTAELTAAFPYRILDGYVLLSGTTPTQAAPAPAVVPVPLTTMNGGGGLRNLAYAVQWWLFALAVLYFWGKLVRDDLAPPDDRQYQPNGPDATPDDRQVARSPVTPAARSGDDARPDVGAGVAAPGAGNAPEDDAEDAELAAYNRYLADLHARPGRRT